MRSLPLARITPIVMLPTLLMFVLPPTPAQADETVVPVEQTVIVSAITSDGDGTVTVEHVPTATSDVAAVIADLRDNTDVVSVQVDRPVYALGVDPGRAEQWDLDTTTVEAAHSLGTGSGITVAVVDTGVSPTIASDITAGHLLAGADFVVDGGNGQADGNGHGSKVAGLIAAQTGNSAGIAGVAPGVSILPVRVLDDSGAGLLSDLDAGIIWAADNGADIVNLSLGSDGACQTSTQTAISYARAQGVVVVGAAGNSSKTTVGSPANCTGVLAVTALASDLTLASFSNYGTATDLTAPGQYVPVPNGSGYELISGTSFSSPFVAAAAALAWSAAPTATATQVESALTSTGIDLGTTGFDTKFGNGLVDPAAAARKLAGNTPARVSVTTTVPATALPGESVNVIAQFLDANNAGAPGISVDLFSRPAVSGGTFSKVATATSLNSGKATFTVSQTQSMEFYFRANGSILYGGQVTSPEVLAVTASNAALTLTPPATVVGGMPATYEATLAVAGQPYANATVTFQTRTFTGTTWTTMGTGTTNVDGVATRSFSIDSQRYVRAVFSGNVDVNAVSSASTLVTPTQVTSTTALTIPSPVQALTSVTATIHVTAVGGKVSAQTVQLFSRNTDGSWTKVTDASTDTDGTATVTIAPTVATTYKAVAIASSSYTASESDPVSVTVEQLATSMTLTGPTLQPLVGVASTFTANVGSTGAGRLVTLQYWNGKLWAKATTAKTDASGVATLNPLMRMAGDYRAVFAGDAGLAASISNTVTISSVAKDTVTMTLAFPASTVTAGVKMDATITGTRSTGVPAYKVRANIQRYDTVKAAWVNVKPGTFGVDGTGIATFAPTVSGDYRLYIPAGTAYNESISNIVALTVVKTPLALTLTPVSGGMQVSLARTDTGVLVGSKAIAFEVQQPDGSWLAYKKLASKTTGVFFAVPTGVYRATFAGDSLYEGATAQVTVS